MREGIIVYLWLIALAGICNAQKLPQSPPAPQLRTNLVSTNAPAPPAGMATKGYGLGSNGTLFLTYPLDWKESVKHSVQKDRVFDAAFFAPPGGNDFNLMIEIANIGENNTKLLDTRARLLEAAQTAGKGELANAVEKLPDVHDLKGDQVGGAYFRITDKTWTNAPANREAPDRQFKYLTRGLAKAGPLVLTFGYVADDTNGESAALDVVRSARFVKGD